jgi:hypothetical protein
MITNGEVLNIKLAIMRGGTPLKRLGSGLEGTVYEYGNYAVKEYKTDARAVAKELCAAGATAQSQHIHFAPALKHFNILRDGQMRTVVIMPKIEGASFSVDKGLERAADLGIEPLRTYFNDNIKLNACGFTPDTRHDGNIIVGDKNMWILDAEIQSTTPKMTDENLVCALTRSMLNDWKMRIEHIFDNNPKLVKCFNGFAGNVETALKRDFKTLTPAIECAQIRI